MISFVRPVFSLTSLFLFLFVHFYPDLPLLDFVEKLMIAGNSQPFYPANDVIRVSREDLKEFNFTLSAL